MPITDTFGRIALSDIIILRDERQRRVVNTDNIIESIKKQGVLSPVILRERTSFDPDGGTHVLIAGERRFTASKQLNLPDIPFRLISDLSPTEAQIIELTENVQRSDLCWQDHVGAVSKLHKLYCEEDETWTQAQTASAIGMTSGSVSQMLRVARSINDPRVSTAGSMISAYNMLSRVDDRTAKDAISDIIEAGNSMFDKVDLDRPSHPDSSTQTEKSESLDPTRTPTSAPIDMSPPPLKQEETILNVDFMEWAQTYTGPKFNFIHCDFPYGIDVFAGKQSGRDKWEGYADTGDIYWKLLGALCGHLDRIMAHSGHLMFWYSMEHYEATLDFFRKYAPSLHVQKFPLIWMKSDNVGILPDPKRGPRRIYETALIASREDRFIIKAVSNGYHAPTDKAHHHSTKPEPMLRHFFQMFVDETSKVLDPTCGSGSSIRAAESLGAKMTLGIEMNEEHCSNARSALRQFRALRRAAARA
jgi:ParB/RepB/Spo0J family partition protein